MMFCPDLNDLCVLASLREIIIVRGNTYPVAYEYDTLGRMVAMATTRDDTSDFAALAVELANGASLTSLGAAWSLDLTQWHYDAATGLLTQKLYADGKGTTYTYTPEGKLASRTWARGVTTTYNYDAAGNLAAISYSDNTPNVSFSYDRFGRQLSAIVDGVSTNLYTYDYETLMLAMENQNGMLINRASDTFGRPVGFTLFPIHLGEGQGEGKPQYSVAYAYDEFGRFASVSSSAFLANLAVQYSYLPDTDIISGYSSGDFTRSISYEPARSLITAVENKFGDSIISSYDYVNDELGRRTAISRSGSAFGDTPVTDSYGYNLRSEVTSARRTLTADPEQAVHGFTHDYAYDPIGNRIAATNNLEAIAYTANSLNQYTAVNETQSVYDDDGNLLSDGRFNYTWNGENRLVMASNETYVVSYAYDHQGRMVWKQIADSNSAAKTISYTWDDFNIVTETICTLQSTIRNYNVWGLDLSQSLQGAGGVGGLLAVISPLPLGEGQGEGSMALACYDANGNITEYLSESGTIAAHYEYSPFGEIAVQTGSLASTFTHRFSTKPWCAVTGFSEYEYRKYCPSLGRWLSRDPINALPLRFGKQLVRYNKYLEGNQFERDVYAFIANKPVLTFDLLGLKEKIEPFCKIALGGFHGHLFRTRGIGGEDTDWRDVDPNSDTGKFAMKKTDEGYLAVGIISCWTAGTIKAVDVYRNNNNAKKVRWVNVKGTDSYTYREVHVLTGEIVSVIAPELPWDPETNLPIYPPVRRSDYIAKALQEQAEALAKELCRSRELSTCCKGKLNIETFGKALDYGLKPKEINCDN